jgi:hypothetical protein
VHAATEHAASLHAAISTLAHYMFGRYYSRNTGLNGATYATCAADIAYSLLNIFIAFK